MAWADDLDSIRYGESVLTYASGSIRQSSPQDGVVNVITGDNQTTGDRMQLGQGDVLYLKLRNPGEASIGDLYSIFKRTRKVFHPQTNRYMGYLVNRLAIVRVTQVEKSLSTVQVIRAYAAISPGDPVVKFTLPEEHPAPDRVPAKDVTGMVVELQANMGMTLVAQRNIVYIDKGREDGVRPGDQMEVVRSGGNLPSRVVGQISILGTEDHTATALITKSTSRILKGDRVHLKLQGDDIVPVSMPSEGYDSIPSVSSAMASSGDRAAHAKGTVRETRITLTGLTKQLRYESGEATIQPDGQRVLDQLVENVKAAPGEQMIRVEGHADDMEIGPALKSRYPTNWDLSKARATGVLRYLVDKGGIDSARISSIGFGDTKPVVSNATEQGRQRNRRVDVVLYTPETGKGDAERSSAAGDLRDEVQSSHPAPDIKGLAAPSHQPVAEPAVESKSSAIDSASIGSDQIPGAGRTVVEPAAPDQVSNQQSLVQP
ncbi:OmpA family protein [Nitrospira sp. KM1]|uniref:OmpA family protein n=1 Tax=Nitrospira sp. KM1 TaxID=1936990 RepID=UPI001564587D|nr:OmpA family protein [Nitrospira sp. KM1]